jgi:hypothetical protein
MGTIVLQEIYHIFMLILCSQIFLGIFLWSSSTNYNSVHRRRSLPAFVAECRLILSNVEGCRSILSSRIIVVQFCPLWVVAGLSCLE